MNRRFLVLCLVISLVINFFPLLAHASPTSPPTHAVLLLIFFVAMSLVVSFLCSVSEAALLSMTPSYIDTLRDDNPKGANLLQDVKVNNIGKSISAILTLNTVAHTLGSLGAGAQATIVFGDVWFGVFSAIMTIVILVGTEIIPKTLGTTYWRRLALPVAYYVKAINVMLMPIIWLMEKITLWMTKGNTNDNHFSRHEFLALASQGEQAGQINALESRIIKNLLALGGINVESVITPRSVMIAFDENNTTSDVFANHPKLSFSRFPIYDEEIDKITGFVLKSDLLIARANQDLHTPIKSYKRDITFVFTKMKLFDLLDLMLSTRIQIAVAVGEYGEVKGLVTLEDIFEMLLGLEIVDEIDKVDDMQLLAKQLMDKRLARIGAKLEEDLAQTDNASQ